MLSSQELAMDALPKRRSAVRAEDALRTGKSLAYKPSYPKRPSSGSGSSSTGGRKRRSAPESIESTSSPSKRARRPAKVAEDNESVTSDEDDEEEDEEVSEEEEDDEEEEEEESQRKKRKGTQRKQRKGKGRESQVDEEEEGETEERNITLKEVMQKGRLDGVVKEWCSIYKARPSQGAVILINMVIAASGCPRRISTAQFEAGDVKEALEELVTSSWTKAGDEAAEGSASSSSSSSSREKAVVAFVGRVLGASKDSFLYDGFLLRVLTTWVGAVSNSSARVLREVATRTACEMVRALIAVVKGLDDLLAKNRAQAARERARATPAARRLAALDETAAEIKEHTGVLQGAVEEIHRTIFAARYRDVVAAIRCEVCRALADDICAWPEVMLRDMYIKYVAWLLNDPAADVRLAAIEGVRQIYAARRTPETQALLETFTERFKPRLTEMALDVSTPVAVAAIDVCRVLATAMHALDEDDLRHLYTLVSEADPARRRAAGAFAQAVAFSSIDEPPPASTGDGAGSSQGLSSQGAAAALAETRVRGVLELVLNHSLLPAMPCYVVDALWAVSPALTDWRTMCAMLLQDAADADDGALSHDEQACLAGVLCSCCRMVAGIPVTPDGSSGSSSGSSSGGTPATRSAVQQEECQEMTAELARMLPKLLVKFRADSEIVAELAGVVPALSLAALEVVRMERACVTLAEELAQVFARHNDVALLTAVSRGLAHLLSARAPHRHTTDVRLVLQTMVASILAAAAETAETAETADAAENTLVAMQRLARLAEFVDVSDICGSERAVDAARTVLADDGRRARAPASLLVAAVAVLYYDVLWRLQRVDAHAPPAQLRARIAECAVAAHRDALVPLLEGVLAAPTLPEAVRDAACVALLDLATAFTPRLADTALRPLACTLGSATVDTLAQYFRGVVLGSLGAGSAQQQEHQEQQDKNAFVDDDGEGEGDDADDDEDEDEEAADGGFSREARVAAAFAKAAIAGGLPSDLSGSFLCLYRFYAGTDRRRARLQQHIDQLCKSVLQGVRSHSARHEWEVVVLALKQVYTEQHERDCAERARAEHNDLSDDHDGGDNDDDDATFVPASSAPAPAPATAATRFATFSRWLARSYGPVPAGDLRTSMFQLVQECVVWALETEAAARARVGILAPAGMVPFVAKLTGPEARLLVPTLDRALTAANLPAERDSSSTDAALAPLYVFAEKLHRLASEAPPATPLAARARPAGLPPLDLVNVDDSAPAPAAVPAAAPAPAAEHVEEPADEIESGSDGDDGDDDNTHANEGPTTKRRRE